MSDGNDPGNIGASEVSVDERRLPALSVERSVHTDRVDSATPGRMVLQDHRVAYRSIEKLLLTPEEAADLLSIGRSTLYELIRLGQLRSVKLGRTRRISTSELREFVMRVGR